MASASEQVRALVAAYAERLDAGDLDGVAALFTDAVVRTAGTGAERVGREAVRRMYDPVILYDDATPRTKHVLSNVEVDIDEPAGQGTSRCVFTVWQAAPGRGPAPVLTGRYEDTFTRMEGTWRFAVRVIYADLLGALSQHMRAR